MLKDNWLERQLATVRELISKGSTLVKQNNLVKALAALKEAEIILDSAESINDDVLNMRAVVYNELGVISTHTRDPKAAVRYHEKALNAHREVENKEVAEHPQRMAATCLNLGGLYASQGKVEEAEACNKEALELLAGMDQDEPNIKLMILGAHQNLGIILAQRDGEAAALEHFDKAVEVADALSEVKNVGLQSSLVQLLLNASVARHKVENHDGALELGQRAADRALALYEEVEQPGPLNLFLSAQMNLITFNESCARFDAGEDALFKVLEVVPGHPEVIKRGKAYYTSLLEKTDDELEEGGLPRDEVQDSLDELKSMKVAKQG